VFSNTSHRQYDIDWIRISLIFSVFLFHIGMVFNGQNWHVKNDERILWLDPIMNYLHTWRMPLLFLVSGVGTRFALLHRNITQFMKERFFRLVIPFVAGMLLLVPVQGYFQNMASFDSLGEYYVYSFQQMFTAGEYNFQHLWFILYLFVISYVLVPFFHFYKSHFYEQFEVWMEGFCQIPGIFIVFSIPILLSQLFLLQFFASQTMRLINDGAYLTLITIYYVYGFVLVGNLKIVGHLVRDRYWYAFMALGLSVLYFMLDAKEPTRFLQVIFYADKYLMGWTISLAILGFAKKYLNSDHTLRKPLNTSIYPFFLMQQPVIVVVAYYIVQLELALVSKAVLISGISLMVMAVFYRYIILRFSVLRLIFGLKGKVDSPGHAVPVVYRFSPLSLKKEPGNTKALHDFQKHPAHHR